MTKAPRSGTQGAAIARNPPRSSEKGRQTAASHRRAPAARELHGLKVARWLTQAEAAELLGITTRWLQKLEARGMPAEGHRASCRYALPHAVVWLRQWRLSRYREEQINALPFAIALARDELSAAIEDAVYAYQLRTDPLYAELHAVPDDEHHARRTRALRDRIRARDLASGIPWAFEQRLFVTLPPEHEDREQLATDEEDVA